LKIIKSTELLPAYRTEPNTELLLHIESYMTESRKSILRQILEQRTKYLTIVAEHFIDEHNIHACIRSSECFGLQEFHNIPERGVQLKKNKSVNRGAFQWTHVFDYEECTSPHLDCIQSLKSRGYKIFATSSHLKSSYTPQDIPIDQPIAIILGNEKLGLRQDTIDLCDGVITIPMYGFTESFNVSVAASLLIQPIIARIHESDVNWKLTESEKDDLYYEWAWSNIKHPDIHYKEWCVNNSISPQ
jgi:tRNA (guanosine-2'-O-)-methyltransferase